MYVQRRDGDERNTVALSYQKSIRLGTTPGTGNAIDVLRLLVEKQRRGCMSGRASYLTYFLRSGATIKMEIPLWYISKFALPLN